VETARVYSAGVVSGATLVATVWLYTYRDWDTSSIRDHGVVVGYAVQPRVHPWWAVLGALILPFIGAGVSLWLLPGGRRLIDRFFTRFRGVKGPRKEEGGGHESSLLVLSTIRRVNEMRVYCAGVVLGGTSVGAVWLYTSSTWDTTLWWALLVAYSLPFIGAGTSLWLLPEGRRLSQRFARYFAKPSY